MTQITLASGPRLRDDDPTAKWQERRRFRGALFFSGLGHAVLIALLFFFWQPASEEAVPLPPIPVTVVKLGQSGASGGGSGDTAASAPSASSEAATAAPSTEPSATETQPQATAAPEPQAPTPPETQPQPPTEVPSLARSTATPAPQETPQPVPPHKPAPPRPKPPAPTLATVPPPSPTVAQAAPRPQQQAQPPAMGRQTASAAANSDAQGVGGRGRGDEGAGRTAVGNGALNAPGDDYLDAVRQWVNRFRKYPDEAVKEKQEGTVALGFKFARDGTVLDAWIEKSSGFPLLDQAALAMIRAASPIPKVPDQYKGDTLTLVMPENFRIGLFDRLFR